MSAITNASVFLIKFCFEFYIYCLLLRLLLQKFSAPFYNPISQFLVKITNILVKPLRKIIPGFKGYDIAIVILLLVFQIIEFGLIIGLQFHTLPGVIGTLLVAVAELLSKIINVFFFAIIINAIMSWVPSMQLGQLREIVAILSMPVLRPIQRFVPLVGGFDLSPLVAILVLQLFLMLLVTPLLRWGFGLAF